MTRARSRRSFLVHGAAAATVALTCATSGAANRVRLHDPKLPAGASGSLWIGGDLQVNRIGFGAAEITGEQGWGEPLDAAAMHALLRRAVDLGVNFIDTADVYGPTVSERLIHEALHPYPSDLVIATKGGQIRRTKEEFKGLDGRPEHLRAACEASLKRLQLEQISLYQMHWPDPNVPYADSIGELGRLQKEGKIRHIGVCNVDAALLSTARKVATIATVQNKYNVVTRQADDVLVICEREKIAFLPFMPLARRGTNATDPHVLALQALADERHIDLPQAALAWLLARSPAILPIPGTSRVEHLEDNVAAARVHFSRADMNRIG
jgi:aryl-alcohol dehydrogenase-like predicted oxidoreductase